MCPPTDPDQSDEDFQKPFDGFPWSAGVTDAHCHPTDTLASLAALPDMRARALTIMATRSQDQDLVASVAARNPCQNRSSVVAALNSKSPAQPAIIPSFGWHPWFSHELYDDITLAASSTAFDPTDPVQKAKHFASVLQPPPTSSSLATNLPDLTPLSALIAQTRARLLAHPLALVGEIGLDKAFRIPEPWGNADDFDGENSGAAESGPSSPDPDATPGSRQGRKLTPHRVSIDHQRAVLSAQLDLAAELGRPVSVHGVQAHGIVREALLAKVPRGNSSTNGSSTAQGGGGGPFKSKRQLKRERARAAERAEMASSGDEDEYGEAILRQARHQSQQQQQQQKPDPSDPNSPPHGNGDNDDDNNNNNNNNNNGASPTTNPPFPPRICLHSFSGGDGMLLDYLSPPKKPSSFPHAGYPEFFFSFSHAVNFAFNTPTRATTGSGSDKSRAAVRACPDDRLLVESDLHVAGEAMDGALERVLRIVCEVKGWSWEEGVRRTRENWIRFVLG